jgi:hypothetical protein
MYKILFIGIILATAYSWDTLPLHEEERELIPRVKHECDHDHLDIDPMREWKAKYVPNPDMTMEVHLESYRDNTLKSTLLAAPWESLRVYFDYRHLDRS